MKHRFFLGPESERALYLNSLAWLAGLPRSKASKGELSAVSDQLSAEPPSTEREGEVRPDRTVRRD